MDARKPRPLLDPFEIRTQTHLLYSHERKSDIYVCEMDNGDKKILVNNHTDLTSTIHNMASFRMEYISSKQQAPLKRKLTSKENTGESTTYETFSSRLECISKHETNFRKK